MIRVRTLHLVLNYNYGNLGGNGGFIANPLTSRFVLLGAPPKRTQVGVWLRSHGEAAGLLTEYELSFRLLCGNARRHSFCDQWPRET
jgi:hypothetical protein